MFIKEINQELDSLSLSNNYRGVLGVLKDYFEIIVAVLISLSVDNIFIYMVTIIFIGTRQRALATILHDSAHRVLCKNKVLNDILGKYFSGYLIFQSFSSYVRSHVINHHNYLGVEEKDPDYAMYINNGLCDIKTKNEFIVKHLIYPVLLIKTPAFVSYLLTNRLGKITNKEFIKILAYWGVIIGTAHYFSFIDLLILYWFIPLLVTFPMVSWFIELAEHFPIITNKEEICKSWNRFGNKLESYLTSMHNENFHLTHHLRPDIPYWNMPKAHQIMMKDEKYAIVNNSMGGIFTAKYGKMSIIQYILKNYK